MQSRYAHICIVNRKFGDKTHGKTMTTYKGVAIYHYFFNSVKVTHAWYINYLLLVQQFLTVYMIKNVIKGIMDYIE